MYQVINRSYIGNMLGRFYVDIVVGKRGQKPYGVCLCNPYAVGFRVCDELLLFAPPRDGWGTVSRDANKVGNTDQLGGIGKLISVIFDRHIRREILRWEVYDGTFSDSV